MVLTIVNCDKRSKISELKIFFGDMLKESHELKEFKEEEYYA